MTGFLISVIFLEGVYEYAMGKKATNSQSFIWSNDYQFWLCNINYKPQYEKITAHQVKACWRIIIHFWIPAFGETNQSK